MSNVSKTPTPINVPERNLTTNTQVNTLLGVCGMFYSMLQGPPQLDEALPKAGTVQGEARLAAEQTFVKACDALQLILEDKQRFDFSFQADIEKHYREASELNRDFLLAQRDAAEENASPHFRWQPKLMRLTNGKWLALLGDVAHIDQGVLGIGDSPAEALYAFDAMFNGMVPESVTEFIKNEKQAMDDVGNLTTENPQSPGQIEPGDSAGNETLGQGG